MINMFSQMACICHFIFCGLPRASYGYIWCAFIPSAVWRFSNYYFQLFRCGNLALNSFSYFSLVAGMFILGGICTPPYIQTAPCPPYVQIPPFVPMLCASVCSRGVSAHDRAKQMASLCLDTSHVFGCLPMCPTLHTHFLPYMSVCSRAYLHVLLGETPHMVGVWRGISTSFRLLVSCQFIHWMSIMLHLVPLL